jgi:hypothetical protein
MSGMYKNFTEVELGAVEAEAVEAESKAVGLKAEMEAEAV